MAEHSSIEWTDATWNPVTGCSVLSPGCANCYAMKLAGTRLQNHPSRFMLTNPSKAGPVWNGEVRFNADWLYQPLRWTRPRRIFVCAHGDLFHEKVPDEWIDQVFAVMALCPQHTFQVLTKRAARMRQYMVDRAGKLARFMIDEYLIKAPMGNPKARSINISWPVKSIGDIDDPDDVTMALWPLPNVWLGVSVEDQKRADERIPDLLATPAAVRFLSCEPLLGPIDLGTIKAPREPDEPDLDTEWFFDALTTGDYYWFDCGDGFTEGGDGPYREHRIDWVIAGGESGPGARPMHPDWVRTLRDQCASATIKGDDAPVPFHFKQWGAFTTVYDRDADDPDWRACGKTADATPTGQWLNLAGGMGFHGERVVRVVPRSKKQTGRLLDGVEHSAFPQVTA